MSTETRTDKKINGLLAVNSFLASPSFGELYESLSRAFSQRGVSLTVKGNAELMSETGAGINYRPDFILFWDKDILLARRLENMGFTLYNSADAIEAADDKGHTAVILEKAGIPMPRTILAPMTFPAIGYKDLGFLDYVIAALGFPMVLKKNRGSFGLEVYLISSKDELASKVTELAGEHILFQEYIRATGDIRIYVAGGKPVAAAERLHAAGEFRANFALGGTMRAYVPTQEENMLAARAAKALKLGFAGVDIIKRESGEPLVLEVNSNAHFKGLSEAAGTDIAAKIADYIIGETEKRLNNN